jgi:hypothetical protein
VNNILWSWAQGCQRPRLCWSCRCGDAIFLNCGHQRAYCSSSVWYTTMAILWRNAQEHRSGSSFSEGHKWERRSGTLFSGIGITNTASFPPNFVSLYVREPFLIAK